MCLEGTFSPSHYKRKTEAANQSQLTDDANKDKILMD